MKPLYGGQEQAARGYNPTKQSRPSHVYQTCVIAAIRVALEVEVQAGNQTASIYAQPGLWAWLDRRPQEQWPKLVRGGNRLGNGGHAGGVRETEPALPV